MSTTRISSWQDLQISDLFYAYRKSKADCYFERSICISREFADYESNLPSHLATLLSQLKDGHIADVLAGNLGRPRLIAKKLATRPKNKLKDSPRGHSFFSDPTRAFTNLCDAYTLTPEFRLVGDFPVAMHVLSALWINLVGHKYDARLSGDAYGSRLRRYRRDSGDPSETVGGYHIDAIGSFQPYFTPYKTWRERGMRSIREELRAERPVIAVSMDLTSYYHTIDPRFIANRYFLDSTGIALSEWEYSFTSDFADALTKWSAMIKEALLGFGCKGKGVRIGGLPIGLSIARVVANALLIELDRDIKQGLAPVYYGRYVDDMFLVLRDPGTISCTQDLMKYISARTQWFPMPSSSNDNIHLSVPRKYKGETTLSLQKTKQKLFLLQGQGGIDLLDNIETQIRSVSSERRLMPSPDRLESMASAKVLTAAGHPAEEADTLRRADGLAVRRLSWAVQLRAVETIARDLRQDDWKVERDKFYQFAHSHILRPDRVLDHVDYLPRLLSLAVALMDWDQARRLVQGTIMAIDSLQKHIQTVENGDHVVKLNGHTADTVLPGIWDSLRETVRHSSADAVSRSFRWSQSSGEMYSLSETALDLCELVGLERDAEDIRALSLRLRESDWAKTAHKDHLRRYASRQRPAVARETDLYGSYAHQNHLVDFLDKSVCKASFPGTARVNRRCSVIVNEQQDCSLLPYLFPTRPYTAQEVSLFLPDLCVFGREGNVPARAWARYVRALRGVWVWQRLVGNDTGGPEDACAEVVLEPAARAFIGRPNNDSGVRLGISSLETTIDSFKGAASGKVDISRARYDKIERLVNLAISAHPRPTHLLLPELSLPERWIDTVSGLLSNAGISLIAGLDYKLLSPNLIYSEAVLVLKDDRLGFPSTVQIRQPKSLPAPGEEEELLMLFGKEWPTYLRDSIKPIYIHQGFCFGVLVCSELQNVSHRLNFQGSVDCVMILSWNRDLETFSSLVESASLDVHAHIALVNNREYGDSRVRSPAKEHFERDLCRLKGGLNEHVVVVGLDIEKLRAFQSRKRRWPRKGDPFKPVPEGFTIWPYRETVPS
jgi:hypothetical protein